VKVLYRYVTRIYLATFGVGLLFVLGLFIIFNVFSKIEDLSDKREQIEALGYTVVGVLLRYYAVSMPFFLQQLIPFVSLIAATIALIRLVRGNEVTPMIAAGRSTFRIALPIYVIGLLLTLGMLAMQEWGMPRLAPVLLRLDMLSEGNVEGDLDDIPPISDGAGNTWTMELYYPLEKGARLMVAEGSEDFGRMLPLSPDEPLSTDLMPEAIDLEVARHSRESARLLSLSEAARMVKAYPDLPRQKVRFHILITWPVGNLLLLLLGIPFVFKLGERNLFVGVGMALAVCAAYFFADTLFQDLGNRAVLPPVVAAWLPILIFGSLTIAIRDALRI